MREPGRNNEEAKEDKKARMKGFHDHFIAQLDDPKNFKGVRYSLKELGIPIGTYQRWLSDPDFFDFKESIDLEKKLLLNDKFLRSILTGEGVSLISSLIAGLKAFDPDWRERLTVGGQIGHVHYTSRVWSYDPDAIVQEPNKAAQITQGDVFRGME